MASLSQQYDNVEDSMKLLQKLVEKLDSNSNEVKLVKKELQNLEGQMKLLGKGVYNAEEERIDKEFSKAARKYSKMIASGGV